MVVDATTLVFLGQNNIKYFPNYEKLSKYKDNLWFLWYKSQ